MYVIPQRIDRRSEEHTSELQSRLHLVCRLLLEKKKHQLTPVHVFLRLFADPRSFLGSAAQNIAGRDLWNVEMLLQQLRLRSFPCPRRSEKNEPHPNPFARESARAS